MHQESQMLAPPHNMRLDVPHNMRLDSPHGMRLSPAMADELVDLEGVTVGEWLAYMEGEV